jgi:hypothetical protein
VPYPLCKASGNLFSNGLIRCKNESNMTRGDLCGAATRGLSEAFKKASRLNTKNKNILPP